jgi:hypothetical protein
MRYTVYLIIVCSCTKAIMISSLRNFRVRILDADRFTIVVFQILDIKSNYLPGIVQHTPQYESLMQERDEVVEWNRILTAVKVVRFEDEDEFEEVKVRLTTN